MAAEIVTEAMTPRTARDLFGRDLEALGMDVLALPARRRRKKLIVADMDSTLITIECIDELAASIGIRSEFTAITERAMAGALDFEAALTSRVALLEGVPQTAIEEVIREGIMPEQIREAIEEDEDIAILILGAATDNKGPGPLVSSLAAGKLAGSFPIPITIVPGDLSIDDLRSLA